MKQFKLVLFTLLQVLTTILVVGAFLGLPYAFYVCKIQPGLSLAFGVVLLLSLVLGRCFCQALCPLGAIQDLVALILHPQTKTRRVCTRLPRSKTQLVVNGVILVLAVATSAWGGFALLNPYGIFGRFVALFTLGEWCSIVAYLFVLVVILAALGKGRFWCNWVCPVGTLFYFLARFSFFKDKIGSRCQYCRKCFAAANPKAPASATAAEGLTRREALKGVAALAVTEKLTDGGYAEVTRSSSPLRAVPILPPGAIWGAKRFAATCVGCQLCAANCPSKCLKPISWSGQVGLDFRDGYCIQNCTKCAEVCPVDALKKLTVLEKRNVHIGFAEWQQNSCLRSKGEKCQACVRKCPVSALHIVGDAVVVDRQACVGCGACEHVCPVRPEPAIVVTGLYQQQFTTPMSEADLLSEMQALVERGESLVIARDGVIRFRLEGSGIKPTLKALNEGRLAKATVCDKVVGRAAAAIFIQGKVKKVWAKVMSADAIELLKKHGVECSCETTVPKILNRDRSDRCPLEKSIDGVNDPSKIVQTLSKNVI